MELEIKETTYKGRYPLFLSDQWTGDEWRWVKQFSGYMTATVDEGLTGGDADLSYALAVIALHRAGKIAKDEASAAFEQLSSVTFASLFTIHVTDEDTAKDDAGPPSLSSNGNEPTSGQDSPTSSGSSEETPLVSGTPGLGSSVFDPPTSVT